MLMGADQSRLTTGAACEAGMSIVPYSGNRLCCDQPTPSRAHKLVSFLECMTAFDGILNP